MGYLRSLLHSFVALGFAFVHTLANAISREDMTVGGGTASAAVDTNISFRDNFFPRIQNYAFAVVALVAVAVFVWIGFKLVSARGNEEEFKKAWMSLTYAVIGLALIPAAYAIIRIVSGFTIG